MTHVTAFGNFFLTFVLSQLFVLERGMSISDHHSKANHTGASVGPSNPDHPDCNLNILSQQYVGCTILYNIDAVRLLHYYHVIRIFFHQECHNKSIN